MTFSYVVNQRTYKIRRDVAGQYTRDYRKGSQVRLVYDPQKPQRCQPLFQAVR